MEESLEAPARRAGPLLAVLAAVWAALAVLLASGRPVDGFVETHLAQPGAGAAVGPLVRRLLGVPPSGLGAPGIGWGLVVLPALAAALIAALHRADLARARRAIGFTVAILVATSFLDLPFLSNDLYLYMLHGETLAARGENPYLHAPADLLPDAALRNVPWTGQPAAYGPLALGLFALARTVSAGFLPYFWTLKALLALPWLALLSWLAASRSPGAAAGLVWLGLNPLLLLELGRSAHLEAWTGSLLLGAVLAARRPTPWRAGVSGALVGLAAAVKLSALVVLGAIAAAAWRAGSGRDRGPRGGAALAAAALAGAALALVATYGPLWAGVHTFDGLRIESLKVVRSVHATLQHLLGLDRAVAVWLARLGLVASAGVGAWLGWRRGTPEAGVVAALALAAIAGRTFFQPWYVCPLILVALASRLDTRQGRLGPRDSALLVASASVVAGGYGVLLLAGHTLASLEASLAVALLPPLLYALARRARAGSW